MSLCVCWYVKENTQMKSVMGLPLPTIWKWNIPFSCLHKSVCSLCSEEEKLLLGLIHLYESAESTGTEGVQTHPKWCEITGLIRIERKIAIKTLQSESLISPHLFPEVLFRNCLALMCYLPARRRQWATVSCLWDQTREVTCCGDGLPDPLQWGRQVVSRWGKNASWEIFGGGMWANSQQPQTSTGKTLGAVTQRFITFLHIFPFCCSDTYCVLGDTLSSPLTAVLSSHTP